jgi:polysaccharide pyruvyl transferase WcaK-like protein
MGGPPLPAVEILGPWLQNNGDALNLHAVAERFSGRATLAVSSTLGLERLPAHPPLQYVKWAPDLATLAAAARSASPRRLARVCRDGVALALAPRTMLAARGIAPGRELAALLDCSGFAYGDVWPTHRVERRTAYYRTLERQGTPVVLLPQAFGPFERLDVRRCCAELFEHCESIYPRDRISREHLVSLELRGKTFEVVPDITHLLDGTPPADPSVWRERVAVVPNARMLDRTSEARSDRYVAFLLQAIAAVRAGGLEPCLLVHERNDEPLAHRIRQSLDFPIAIVMEDALVSKGILGACHAVIASRYHALISALSQGVPAIGTSWSHKYEELFGDYQCAEYLLSPEGESSRLEAAIADLLRPEVREEQAGRLVARAREQKAKVEEMWARVEPLVFHGDVVRTPC